MNSSINRFLNVRSAYGPRFSSDGRRLAFIADIGGVPQAWMIEPDFDSGRIAWPEQLTFGESRVMRVAFSPRPGDGRLIYAQDTGGDENSQFFLLSGDGSADLPLTEGHEAAVHIFGDWSADGRQIAFGANRRDPGLFDAYVQALDGQAQMVWQNDRPGFLGQMVFSPDGHRIAANRMVSSFHNELFEIDLVAGSVRSITPSTDQARYLDICYAADGRSLFMHTDLDSDFLRLARLDLGAAPSAKPALETLLALDWDTEYLALSPDGQSLAYAVNVQGASELYLLNLNTGQKRQAPLPGEAPGVVALSDWYLEFSPDGRRLAFSYTSAIRTSDVFIWDLDSDRVMPVTRSSHGGLPLADFIAPELVHYPTFDSDRPDGVPSIPAWFYKPADVTDEPLPVIVFVHGGPEWQFKPFFHFFIQYFVQNGYAVLAPNVRGSTGYGKDYSHLDDVEKRLDSVADLAHAALWLRERPDVDGERIVVYGGSYGGFMVLAALTNYPNWWAAGVDVVGISDFVTFLENTSDYRRAHREAEYGSLEHDRQVLESISPIHQVDQIVAPMMVIHGANDPRVPLSEAEQLVEALKAREVPVEFLVFDDEGHGIHKLKNKLVAYPAVVDFLNRHL
ncbi:MAG: S9 family peptidase [Chloroflexota bacterium]|nr:MAG: S9 family peptidase [Chloroflexota bacterium]